MWYAIFVIAGILLGLGMMIWALLERKKRYEAEVTAATATAIAEKNVEVVKEVQENLERTVAERDMLVAEIVKMRDFIIKNVDPEVVYEYIRSDLDGTEI